MVHGAGWHERTRAHTFLCVSFIKRCASVSHDALRKVCLGTWERGLECSCVRRTGRHESQLRIELLTRRGSRPSGDHRDTNSRDERPRNRLSRSDRELEVVSEAPTRWSEARQVRWRPTGRVKPPMRTTKSKSVSICGSLIVLVRPVGEDLSPVFRLEGGATR